MGKRTELWIVAGIYVLVTFAGFQVYIDFEDKTNSFTWAPLLAELALETDYVDPNVFGLGVRSNIHTDRKSVV